MKLAILGATGQTGKHMVQQALDVGHEVTAIVRTASKMNITHDKLTVVEANIFSNEDLKKCFQGVDAVLSTLGFSILQRTITGYSDVAKCTVNAMREIGCKRLILMHSWYTEKTSRNIGSFFVRWVMLPLIRPAIDDMRVTELFLESDCSDIDYTVVQPPGLIESPKTDAEFQVLENSFFIPEACIQMARADVARYMLKILDDESSYKKIHCIAIKNL